MGLAENFLVIAFVLIFALVLFSAIKPILSAQVTDSLGVGIAVLFAGAVVVVVLAFVYSELTEGDG